jgi:hypothetical protein
MDTVEPSTLEKLIEQVRRQIYLSHLEFRPNFEDLFRHVDGIIGDGTVSPLEKAMYLLLNQYVGDQQDYFVMPRERVRVPEVYELVPPGYKDYEIDFAVYSGSAQRLVKIAVACDGVRSHRERHADRDRHKDVNLQAAGWTVLRFGSREIHEELKKVAEDDTHTNRFVNIIENVVAGQTDALTRKTYHRFRDRLTGYTFGDYRCPKCDHRQWDQLELPTICRKCGEKLPAQRP